jgi:hypothetical protein
VQWNASQTTPPIFLIEIVDGKYGILGEITTDENGVWFVQDVPPGTYTIMNKPPTDFGDTLLGTWEVPADQITDFGDVDFAQVGCEP